MEKSNYDYAIGFDGDGDRVIFIDKSGDVYNGDKLLYVLANFLNSSGKLNNSGVVGTQMTNLELKKNLNKKIYNLLELKLVIDISSKN